MFKQKFYKDMEQIRSWKRSGLVPGLIVVTKDESNERSLCCGSSREKFFTMSESSPNFDAENFLSKAKSFGIDFLVVPPSNEPMRLVKEFKVDCKIDETAKVWDVQKSNHCSTKQFHKPMKCSLCLYDNIFSNTVF